MTEADLLIIGGGPAGVTAAIYAARKGLDFLMISRDIGGQAAWSAKIENYTGCQVVSGADLTTQFEEHLKKFNIRLRQPEAALSLAREGGKFVVRGEKDTYRALAVIAATGKRSRELGVPGEKEFLNRGLTYCAVCDGPLFAAKDVAVIGGGNSALDAALQMSRVASKVYVVDHSREFSADKILQDRLRDPGNVEVLNNTYVRVIHGGRFVEGIRVSRGGKETDIPVQGVFVEIGLVPNSDFAVIAGRNEKREIRVNCANETDVPGLFAAGDVTDVPEKQIIIAAGEGAKAALSAAKYLISL
ncbi:MAG: FAD-dependent oxidoreductase [Candidatus Omnitrophota bacterium]|jgi:alkyl hydroperoxide reductase subunit F